MNQIVVYSTITNSYEEIKNNQNIQSADFVMFIDKPVKSDKWVQKTATNLFSDPRRNARWHKINSLRYFPEYRFNIWLDGSMEMKTNAYYLIDTYLKDNDIAVFKHPLRDCLYEEAESVVSKGFEDRKIIDEQVSRYLIEQYPRHNGLGETKCVIRRNNPKIKEFEKLWGYEVNNYSKRDQVSFNYCVWKIGLKIAYIPVDLVNREAVYPNFNYIKHNRL